MRGGRSGARRVASIDSGARLDESSRTTRDEPQPRMWALRVGVAVAAVTGTLAATGLSVAAASFADEAGDANAAPDITSIRVSVSADALATIDVSIGNYMTLPADSWINVWFDDDSNEGTGYGGDETLVRYLSSGQLEFYEWDGLAMLRRGRFRRVSRARSPTGYSRLRCPPRISAATPRSGCWRSARFDSRSSCRSSRPPTSRRIEKARRIRARRWRPSPIPVTTRTSRLTSAESGRGHEGRVDQVRGSTPRTTRRSLPTRRSGSVSTPTRAATSDDDQAPELRIGHRLGQTTIERWRPRSGGWVEGRLRISCAGAVRAASSAIDLRRSAVGGAKRFGFSVTTADFDPNTGVVHALDLRPSNGGFYRYVFTNESALTLVAGQVSATPRAPRAGSRFAVTLPVRRSDTGRPAATGPSCAERRVGRARLSGVGTLTRTGARCSFAVPGSAAERACAG